MAYRWVYSEPESVESVRELKQKLGVPDEIARLLVLRNVRSFDDAKTFFRPETVELHDPFLMRDMEAAADRLSAAVRGTEKVLIYGDYDVDGTTATALLYLFLKQFGADVSYYIPHRFKEGYGISSDGVQHAIDEGVDLVVSVDCGISAVEEAEVLRKNGVDLIVCDHHTVGEVLPDAVAVLDPKRPDCGYPFDGLSGAGVGFKLAQAATRKLGLPPDTVEGFLDLVAVSIASDIVPVVGENRMMMREGLDLINRQPRPGIRALMDACNMKPGQVSTTDIVFNIGPRINAAGRMGDASLAVELMISQEPAGAARRAGELEQINRKRRKTDSQTMEEAQQRLEERYDIDEISSMVLFDPGWHLGVIGIVASRLVDRFYRPVVMLSLVDGMVKGSARSIKGFNIYDALRECDDLLVQFGGHEYAAGLTMEEEKLPEFRHRLDEIAKSSLSENDFEPELSIDAPLDLDQVDRKFWKLLSQFEPFGPGNSKPVFASQGVEVVGVPAIVGKGHLKMQLRQNGSSVFDAIGFNMHEYMPVVRESGGGPLDVAFVIEENFWRERRSLQLQLRDVKKGG